MSVIQLRYYQEDAIRGVCSSIGRGHTSVLVVMPTGSGKTVLFSELPNRLFGTDPVKVLILAHRDELVTQAQEKYLKSNPQAFFGIERGQERADPATLICAASVQTLKGQRLETFLATWGVPRLIITDEAHHSPAPGYKAIYEAVRALGARAGQTVYHVGVTATPARGDRIGLETVFSEIAYAVSIEELIERQYLADIRGFVVRTQSSLAGLKKTQGDYKLAELAAVVNTDERNAEIVRAYADLTPHRPAICFTVDVSHSRNMAEAFTANGFAAAHLDGTTPRNERRQILEDFRAGKITILSNCAVLCEGFDEPRIEVVIMARPTMSASLFAQCIGRATRLAPKKDHCVIIDIHDISRHRSCFSLPALFGMPPNFNLQGKSARTTAQQFRALEATNPLAGQVLADVSILSNVAAMDPAERLRFLIDAVKAHSGLKYIPVDMLRPRPIPEYLRDSLTLTWHVLDETTFRLIIHGDTLTVQSNQLGQWQVIHQHKEGAPYYFGASPDLQNALRKAENWMRQHRPRDVALLTAQQRWHNRPLTGGQRSKLKKLGVKAPRDTTWTAGEGSALIEQLVFASSQK